MGKWPLKTTRKDMNRTPLKTTRKDMNRTARKKGSMTNKKCTRCGKCCKSTDHVSFSKADVKEWENYTERKGINLELSELLLDPEVKLELDYIGGDPLIRKRISKYLRMFKKFEKFRMIPHCCPFLYKEGEIYGCAIQDIKPKFCSSFKPGSKHAKRFCQCPA